MNKNNKDARIFVTGHRGMAGPALVRRLRVPGCTNMISAGDHLNLLDQVAVCTFLVAQWPDHISIAAAIGLYSDFKCHEALLVYARLFESARLDDCRDGALLQVTGAAQLHERNNTLSTRVGCGNRDISSARRTVSLSRAVPLMTASGRCDRRPDQGTVQRRSGPLVRTPNMMAAGRVPTVIFRSTDTRAQRKTCSIGGICA